MRLVKRSINQDDPGTYHLFYADAEGHPGTDLTFFPWAQMAPPRPGHGLAVSLSSLRRLAVDRLGYGGFPVCSTRPSVVGRTPVKIPPCLRRAGHFAIE
jgi:catechol 2,3-dioxygenase-like lactoylglutathione lyase family enzyme